MKLGKAAKEVDPRTIQYRAIRAVDGWEPPASYSFDAEHPGTPTPVFANDQLGDCVIADEAHFVTSAETLEQGAAPPITDAEVKAVYFRLTGGADNGLVMLSTMRDWRNVGRLFGGKTYTIHSFCEVQPQDHLLVKEGIIVGTGLHFGVNLPLSAADQMNAHAPWDLVSGPRGQAGSWGGHAILAREYDAEGVTFVTWGKRQKATWRWVDAYADECYLVVDDVDRFAADDIDKAALAAALENL